MPDPSVIRRRHG